MLHEKSHRSSRRDGTGIGGDAGSGDWTGEKRRKPSLRSEVRASSSDSTTAEEDQQDPFFTAKDLEAFTIGFREVMRITASMKENHIVLVDFSSTLNKESQRLVYERLMLYRLKAHKLAKGESKDKLDDETLRKELSDILVKVKHIPQLHSAVDTYFKSLESKEKEAHVSVDWYFDPEFSKLQDLANYQRLVLKKNHGDVEYLDWEGYRPSFTTYEMDDDYIRFFTEMSQKLQWLKNHIGTKGSQVWETETEIKGAHQALKIAKSFRGVTVELAYTAYREHIWSLHYDYLYREGWDIIFFNIWKLVNKKKMEFTYALIEVMDMKLFPQHDASMLRFLKNRRLFDLESKFDICVEAIPPGAGDETALDKIKKALWNIHKKKMRHQYIERKMSIAVEIGLDKDSNAPRMGVYEE